MNTRVGWRHDNELGARPEIDGPVRVEPELQDAWHMYYGNAGDLTCCSLMQYEDTYSSLMQHEDTYIAVQGRMRTHT